MPVQSPTTQVSPVDPTHGLGKGKSSSLSTSATPHSSIALVVELVVVANSEVPLVPTEPQDTTQRDNLLQMHL